MALYKREGVDGNGGIYSLNQDPLKAIEYQVIGSPGSETQLASVQDGTNTVTAVSPGPVRIIARGSGYSDATGAATSTTTAALNRWSGQAVHDPALTTVEVDITTVGGEVVNAVVSTGAADTVGYRSGDWLRVTGGNSDCLVEITQDVT
jgi:hypothetical protein